MIASEYIAPNHNIFYIGAKLIEIISKKRNRKVDIMGLYNEYIKLNDEIPFEYYLVSITWLFMLHLIDNSDKDGDIKKCF